MSARRHAAFVNIDGNGTVDPMDGLLVLRYMFGLRGDALVGGIPAPVGIGWTAPQIEAYLQSLMP